MSSGQEGMEGGGGREGMGTLRIKKGTAVMTAPDAPYLAG
jgi:hypothetical protein